MVGERIGFRRGAERRVSAPHKQRGAAAIEASLLFMIFFFLFYAIASYALPMVMIQSFHHAAAAGARAAVAVDPDSDAFEDDDQYVDAGVVPRAREVVGNLLDWLPDSAKGVVLGNGNGNVGVEFDQGSGLLTVTVSYPNYTANPLIPILRLPVLGDVPKLPSDLTARASIHL